MNEYPPFNASVPMPVMPVLKLPGKKIFGIVAATLFIIFLVGGLLIWFVVANGIIAAPVMIAGLGAGLSIVGMSITLVSASKTQTKIRQAVPMFRDVLYQRYGLVLSPEDVVKLLSYNMVIVIVNGYTVPLMLEPARNGSVLVSPQHRTI